MVPAKFRKGSQVRSWCTRCREMTAHVIASMRGSQPSRVTCQVCEGTHNYRPLPPRSRSPARRRAAPSKLTTAGWDELVGVADLSAVRAYAMRRSYSAGDVIRHKVFGIGIVLREVDERKIEVSFEDGIRLLACNFRR
ncbi:MAG: hypothetical protein GF330_09560 [Candidatus Eisenbacteria bacterium]|nr:hypothetical protein [Candidatus Eisenbacteria bacterium]